MEKTMKRTGCLTLLLLLLASHAGARLGETPSQCARRYGDPLKKLRLSGRSGYEYQYERGNYQVAIRFVRSNKTAFHGYEAGYISYNKKDHSAFDRKTVETILKKNLADQVLYSRLSRDMFWEEVEDVEQEDIDKEWVRVYRDNVFEDGKRIEKTEYADARANLSDDHVLVISSRFPLPRGYSDWEERQEALAEQEQSSKSAPDFF